MTYLARLILISIIPVAGFAGSDTAFSAVIVSYNFSTPVAPGDQAFQTPAAAAVNTTGLNFIRGVGLNAVTTASSINSNGWDSVSGSTLTDNDYFSFGFSTNSGTTVSLTSLSIRTRSSGTGPGVLGLFYSGNSFATSLFTFTQPATLVLDSTVDLSSLTNLSGTIEFRILQIGNTSADSPFTTSSAGTFRVQNFNGSSASPVTLNGTVNAVPEPSVIGLMAFVAVLFSRGWLATKPALE